MSAASLILALLVTFLAASIQGVVGMGFAMVSVPILALIDPRLAPVPQLLITMPLTISMAWRERRHVELSGIGWIMGGRIPGAVIGVALLAVATQAALDVAIAAMVLLGVAVIGSGYRLVRTPSTDFSAGVLSGVSGLVASIGGPPLALLYSRDDGPTRRSNLAVIFTLGLMITLGARVVSGNITWGDVLIGLVLFPAVVVGYRASIRLRNRVSQSAARSTILVLSLGAAIGLIIRAAG